MDAGWDSQIKALEGSHKNRHIRNVMIDGQMIIWHLNGRSSLAVTGQDAEAFLNDVLTLDITNLPADSVTPAVLLTPQGRIIFDLLISRITDGFRLECDQNRIDDLIKKLRLYRLRRAVDLTPRDESVFAMVTEPHDAGWMKDSRFQDIMTSRYYGAITPDNQVKIAEDDTAYRAMRYQCNPRRYKNCLKKKPHLKPDWIGYCNQFDKVLYRTGSPQERAIGGY